MVAIGPTFNERAINSDPVQTDLAVNAPANCSIGQAASFVLDPERLKHHVDLAFERKCCRRASSSFQHLHIAMPPPGFSAVLPSQSHHQTL